MLGCTEVMGEGCTGRLQDHLDSTQGCVGRCGACRWAGDSRPSFHL
jgi:hypothetical protein